ncbi:hypothetical protein [Streptomyces griseocarneus]|uniref:hypothetical protein n=1 Tax=Streptomyces griseocarneus TaxID=51201 RepID=UPI00167D7801|nr:hypothetical protein [Streptomyces griseocarneus]MBZ6473861.1 hypothetical protein [Streptomyces griseocarneus]GHG65580.1 hypothetical protein GCM10018779_36340 [Streptomyces griseocarneus]
MWRHDFEPGKVVVGLVLIGGCLAYLAAAGGWWHFPSYLLLPVMAVGFCVAGTVSSLVFAVRRHRARGTDRPDGLS